MPKFVVALLFTFALDRALGQSAGGKATLRGVVQDSSGLPVPGAAIEISRTAPGVAHTTRSGPAGDFAFAGIAAGNYVVRVAQAGFAPYLKIVESADGLPVEMNISLSVAGQQSSVTVNGTALGLVDAHPTASNTLDRRLIEGLPALSPDSGLNDAIIYTTPGVAADSNGFFHPMGDHAQVSYVIDGQPVSDQRNKVFSTSIPANAIQSLEVVSGSPGAEYGDKTSLVINATTRSGLGQRPSGSLMASFGSYGTAGIESAFGAGTPRWGNFLVFNAERTDRFLDTPEFQPRHDTGNTGTLFERVDFQPGGRDAFHLNVMMARNWLQVPNTYEQARQDQKQKVVGFNIAPGYQHTVNAHTSLSMNAFIRRDEVDYYGSRNPVDDSPASLAQARSLGNAGVRADLSGVQGRHNWKVGLNAARTRLEEQFTLGFTNSGYNAPCLPPATGTGGDSLRDPSECAGSGFRPNPGFLRDLLAYDLTRGGRPYEFRGAATIHQLAFFGQDSITLGAFTLSAGLRMDRYRGLTEGEGWQPRAGFSYLVKATGTVIRGGYTRTLETPTNENLVVSSTTGSGGLANALLQGSAEQRPIALGRRNQYDAGVQQALGKWVVVDVSYFRKYTRNAYDFDTLFNTPVTVPIAWKQSKLDGVAARITSVDMRGLRIFATMGHANARFFGPENGGIVFNSNLAVGAYRQDHDQVYQQNVNVHYQPAKDGWWADFTWRYDSGLVVGAVNNLEDALALTADQQAVIGLYCGEERAALSHRIASCSSPVYGAERIQILAPGAENDDRNPPRAMPRHIFNLGAGTGNLFHTERLKTVARFTVLNLANEAALYNFLSPFSGTHWVQPRSFQVQFGLAF